MLFKYKALDDKGVTREGEIDAANRDLAISGLQRRGLIVISIKGDAEKRKFLSFSFLEKVSMRQVVILSRQIATLFEAQVSALKTFSMLASSSENKILAKKLTEIGDDLQAGLSISGALAKHPDVFSSFYVSMVKAGEEVGKLDQTFLNLSEYLDRQYNLSIKARNALIYPAFVIFTFIVVMSLMFMVVIPKLSAIIVDSGQAIPVYTRIVIGFSNFFVNWGFIIFIFLILAGIWLWWLSRTEKGKTYIDRVRLSTPLFGRLYKKLFLSRISDNMDTMLTSGIPIIRSIDITSEVVGSHAYKDMLREVADNVKGGLALSASFEKHPEEIPGIMVQMVKVGEETGSLGPILKTLAVFYKREVDDAVDTLVGLIEPVMIIVLGLGVGLLLVSVLVPIYNIAGSIS
ncbi:MAG: type II secretion system F family protein [Patescibacteria group bacterium]